MLIGFIDKSGEYTPLGIKKGLERAGFVHNIPYNRMKYFGGKCPIPSIEYLKEQNCIGIYAYPEEIGRVIPSALSLVRGALPSFQPKLMGLGSCEQDGSKIEFTPVPERIGKEITDLLR